MVALQMGISFKCFITNVTLEYYSWSIMNFLLMLCKVIFFTELFITWITYMIFLCEVDFFMFVTRKNFQAQTTIVRFFSFMKSNDFIIKYLINEILDKMPSFKKHADHNEVYNFPFKIMRMFYIQTVTEYFHKLQAIVHFLIHDFSPFPQNK